MSAIHYNPEALMSALAAADDAGFVSQTSGADSITTSEFLKQFSQKLAQFHGNMAQIENFIKGYLQEHALGSSARDHMSDGAILSLQGLAESESKMEDYDKQLKDMQTKIDGIQNQASGLLADMQDDLHEMGLRMSDLPKLVNASTSDLISMASGMYGDWLAYYMERGGFLCPAVAAGLALGKVIEFKDHIQNLSTQADGVTADLKNQQKVYANVQGNAEQLVAQNSGNMSIRSNAFAAPGHALMSTANQIAQQTLAVVSLLDRSHAKDSQNEES